VCWTMWLKFVPAEIMAMERMSWPRTRRVRPVARKRVCRGRGMRERVGKRRVVRMHSRRAVVWAMV